MPRLFIITHRYEVGFSGDPAEADHLNRLCTGTDWELDGESFRSARVFVSVVFLSD